MGIAAHIYSIPVDDGPFTKIRFPHAGRQWLIVFLCILAKRAAAVVENAQD